MRKIHFVPPKVLTARPCLDNLMGRVAEVVLYILFKPFVTKIKYKTNQVPNIANWLNSRPDTVL